MCNAVTESVYQAQYIRRTSQTMKRVFSAPFCSPPQFGTTKPHVLLVTLISTAGFHGLPPKRLHVTATFHLPVMLFLQIPLPSQFRHLMHCQKPDPSPQTLPLFLLEHTTKLRFNLYASVLVAECFSLVPTLHHFPAPFISWGVEEILVFTVRIRKTVNQRI